MPSDSRVAVAQKLSTFWALATIWNAAASKPRRGFQKTRRRPSCVSPPGGAPKVRTRPSGSTDEWMAMIGQSTARDHMPALAAFAGMARLESSGSCALSTTMG